MSNYHNYTTSCEVCGQTRTCNASGLCHRCQVEADERDVIVDEDGEEWVPGGFRL